MTVGSAMIETLRIAGNPSLSTKGLFECTVSSWLLDRSLAVSPSCTSFLYLIFPLLDLVDGRRSNPLSGSFTDLAASSNRLRIAAWLPFGISEGGDGHCTLESRLVSEGTRPLLSFGIRSIWREMRRAWCYLIRRSYYSMTLSDTQHNVCLSYVFGCSFAEAIWLISALTADNWPMWSCKSSKSAIRSFWARIESERTQTNSKYI